MGGALLSPVAGYLVARWNPRLLVSLAPTLPLFLAAMGVGGGVGFDRTGGFLAIYLWAFAIALTGFTLTSRASGPVRA